MTVPALQMWLNSLCVVTIWLIWISLQQASLCFLPHPPFFFLILACFYLLQKVGHCSFSLDIALFTVSMHPQTSLKYLNLIELFIPYDLWSCPALVHKPAVPLKTIHNHRTRATYGLVSAFLSLVNGRYVELIRGLAEQVMTRFSKGIGCTGGSAVEAQAEGALTASCRVAWPGSSLAQAWLCWVGVSNKK